MESLKIKVDVKRRTTENINLQQGYTYPIELTILDNGKEYDCTGATPQIHFAKSNGTFSIKTKDITIEGNKISFILDSEATNRSGTGKLQAVLTRNGFTFGSWAIFCNIFENVIQDGATEDKNVIDILTELSNEVTTAKPLADSLNANIPKAQPLVNSLNTQIPQATEIAREIESIIEEGGAVDKRELGEYKKDFEGVEHDTLNSRLNRDFDNLHQRMNDSSLLAYEGTSIKADNTYLGLTKDTVIKGRTLQNCIKDVADLYHGKGSYNNKWITMQQKTDGDVAFSYLAENILLKPNTVYTMFLDIKENTILDKDSAYTYHFSLSKSGLGYGDFACNLNSIFGKGAGETGLFREKFTYREVNGNGGVKIGTGGFIAKSTTGNNGKIVFRIFILEGDHTQTPLEELPYVEGIESTGDKSKNLINPNAIIDNTTINNYGVEASDTRYIATDFIKVNPNTSYFTTGLTVGHEYDDNKNFIRVIRNTSSDGIFLTSSNGGYVRLRNYALLENKEAKQEIINKCMLCVGTQDTSYQEYYDGYEISGKSCGKNLFDIRKWYGALYGDNTPSEITEDGKVIVYAKNSDTYIHTGVTGNFICTEIERKHLYLVHENTTYTLSMKCEGEDYAVNYIQFYDENYNSLGLKGYGTDTGFKITFKTPMRTKFLGIRVGIKNATIGSSLCYSDFQLEENDHATPYEPYKESNYSYILNEPLHSLSNGVCDTIDLATGVIARRVGKYTLKGTEPFSIASEVTGNVMCLYSSNNNLKINRVNTTNNIMCDKIPVYKYGLYTDIECIMASDSCIIVSFKNVSDYNEAIEKLKSNPVTFYYELAEPTTEQLTPCQLKSFDTTTHIISDNKLMPIVSTKIPSDVNAVVQNLKAENKNLEKQLDSAIEELNNTDIDLMAIDWETDYRLCELEWTLLDTMKVETLAENKVVENRILSRYEQAKILIESGKYNKSTMEKQLTMYYNRNYLTKEEFNELMQLMNPIGEVETLEELDKVENI